MTWDPPGELEEYRIVRPLGAGAMGLVFLAHDTLLDRPVAIKFISAREVGDTARERFYTEARAVARLSHPNVVAVHRVGEVHHRPYLVSEYVRGSSLAQLAKPVPWERALKIAIGLARGLGAAHRAGVLHRDIKPANVMIGEDDEPKLLDFGLAKLMSAGALPPLPDALAPPTRPSGRALATEHEIDATISMAASLHPIDRGAPPAGLSPTSQTQEGAILGTPLYLAPERWTGAQASQASDVYALGIVLYELLVGAGPHVGMTLPELAVRVPAEDVAAIASQVGDLPTQLADLIDACVARDPARRPASGDALCDLLEAVMPRALPLVAGSPYRGLSTFESEHRAVFFGRAAEARAVVERLRTETLVIVAGDSGAGKSSLCRAAVLPAVAEKALAGTRWRVTAMVPGTRPLARLEAALAERRPEEGLLVFIDQLEELLTLAEPAEAAQVGERLAELVVATSSVRVLASARSDYLGRLAGLPGIGELVGRALFLLAPLKNQGLLDAIQGPARAAGYTFESAETIDELMISGRGHLPLLQFALSELWDARDQARKVIPADALSRIGGVAGALARHADHVLAGLPPSERRAARAILLSLVTAETTQARRSHVDVLERALQASPRGGAALDALVRGRLLIVQEAELGDQAEYAIAHEALLHGWETLRRWLEHDATGRSTRQRLDRAAEAWDQLGRPAHALWNEHRLREAAGIELATLPARDAAFLGAGRRLAARQRRRLWAVAIGVVVAAAGASAGVRLKAAHDRAVIMGAAQLALAQARFERARVEGVRQAAFARFDAGDADVAERGWREARAGEPAVEHAYASVAERLERLLQDDPGDGAARGLLSTVLFERAELADAGGRGLERDDLVRRLGVYGSSARWSAPARLSIEAPPGATVQLRRYQPIGDRWVASAATRIGVTPLPAQRLAPGSVVLELSRPGSAAVRLPVLLARGGDEHVRVALPPASAVPDGFVVVPGGAFLYGSAEDVARATYDSEPRHRVHAAPYLIARDETTYGDWIGFLRALPAAERAARVPGVHREGFTIELTEQADHGYRLVLGPDAHPYSAREGEPIVYPGRARRARQDWSRLPVTAISFEDVLAYTAWLDASGRVPGARPCTEHEWELAARGADGRAFPGGERLEADDANHDLTYGRRPEAFGPDEVGAHLASDSPFGVHDLSGNVWEWTASRDPAHPVARGGGFYQAAAFARPENRAVDVATRRDAFYGARVCASVAAADRDEN